MCIRDSFNVVSKVASVVLLANAGLSRAERPVDRKDHFVLSADGEEFHYPGFSKYLDGLSELTDGFKTELHDELAPKGGDSLNFKTHPPTHAKKEFWVHVTSSSGFCKGENKGRTLANAAFQPQWHSSPSSNEDGFATMRVLQPLDGPDQ
eukprot:2210130-Amphidinium_carterae.1